MISGTLTPSAANLISHPKNIVTEEINDEIPNGDKTRTDTSGRSAALERAYVHDVYENCEESAGSIRPKVAQFLAGLDAGSLVCDVGCGNGRYLAACNPLICTLGIDRCYRLAKAAKSKGGEVALCDNLELPFRDESFDAVLSVAVVHHFATTERRVGAIRELARILRIGGRVIITVWALEQKQRRFESQDVLIPWQPPKSRHSNFSDDEDEDDFLPPYHAYTEDSTNSSRSAGDGDSSSLSSSSPGESCYSFVRRAIQKLAGGKRHPWFLESWNSKDTKNGSSLDYEDAKDLPIELRRLEDFEDFPEPPLSAGLKSRSLGSILNPPPRQIVRSRSSVPSLGAQIPEKKSTPPATENRRPKLVKQKQSLCDEEFQLPDTHFSSAGGVPTAKETRLFLRKQSSLNEELMAENRIREKERVRKRIQKQMSLNEAFLCRSLFTKRLQVIREGFTTKLKTSTGSLERVTKNGLVKIIKNFGKPNTQCNNNNNNGDNVFVSKDGTNDGQTAQAKQNDINGIGTNNNSNGTTDEEKARRHSRESGSDSSKDSSLQSDTSIESEDSFASVIFIPRPEQQQQQQQQQIQQQQQHTTNSEHLNNMKPPSVPTSPLIMPCPTPAHSPAAPRCKFQPNIPEITRFPFEEAQVQKADDTTIAILPKKTSTLLAPTSTSITPSVTTASTKLERITRQIVKNLPQIPKFKKTSTSNFPIIRRSTITGNSSVLPTIPKLTSMEIFNPETDDLDSDSSEPSSPDSIDSVISALKPAATKDNDVSQSESMETSPNIAATKSDSQSSIDCDSVKLILRKQESISSDEPHYHILNEDTNDDDIHQHLHQHNQHNHKHHHRHHHHHHRNVNNNNNLNKTNNNNKLANANNQQQKQIDDDIISRQNLVDFAEKLSAQLLKELDENPNNEMSPKKNSNSSTVVKDKNDSCSVSISDIMINNDKNNTSSNCSSNTNSNSTTAGASTTTILSLDDPYIKKLNGEIKDLNSLREELRERRLMLANLNSHQFLQSSSTNSTIHEEDESPRNEQNSDGISLTTNDCGGGGGGGGSTGSNVVSNYDLALLIEEDGEYDEDDHDDDDIDNKIICNQLHAESVTSLENDSIGAIINSTDNLNVSLGSQQSVNINNNCNSLNQLNGEMLMSSSNNNTNHRQQQNRSSGPSIESRHSLDSWAHSNSTASLDSPSVGGSSTHHRYYHVFREGELDALINHHVTSLHIVSSYYERASWCVVAEKVQVWTI